MEPATARPELEVLCDNLADVDDRYVLFGDAAFLLALESAGLRKDLQDDRPPIVRILALDAACAEAFWSVVEVGNYRSRHLSAGDPEFHRFTRPDPGFPPVLEIHSRIPDLLGADALGGFELLRDDDDGSYVAEAVCQEECFRWAFDGVVRPSGVPIVRPEHLLPIHARCILALLARRPTSGTPLADRLRNHRDRLLRLLGLADPRYLPDVPPAIAADVAAVLDRLGGAELPLDDLDLDAATRAAWLDALAARYPSGDCR